MKTNTIGSSKRRFPLFMHMTLNLMDAMKFKRFFGIVLVVVGMLLSQLSFAQAPTISSFSPLSGSVGTLVTISGSNLSNPTVISIGGVNAIPISNTGTSLVAMAMPGAVTGTVDITSAGGSAISGSSFTVVASVPPAVQQGSKLVGIGCVGNDLYGNSVSVSADGNTAIVGAYNENGGQGTARIYTRSGGVWSQQGSNLIGTGNIGAAIQGWAVSISADGNTAIVSGRYDDSHQGAIWVFTRSGGVWSQQGNKLVGTGNVGAAYQGYSISLSADGNTFIVGGYDDNSGQGAAWVFNRSGGVWSQQGAKLVGTGSVGNAKQGISVSLSADGNTAIVGGDNDNSNQGAAWVYTRSGSVWSQQGSKLVGTGSVGNAWQGISVCISADGNTAIVCGAYDNSNEGAAWVYNRSGGVWTQQGSKIVGTGNVGAAHQGSSVSISSDGNTAIVGGHNDDSDQGAVWVYTQSAGVWSQKGSKLVGSGNLGAASQGASVSISADGNTAIVGGLLDDGWTGAAWVFGACTVNIPDANFKAALVSDFSINTNHDAEIQCTEAAAYTGTVTVYGLHITDLTGIEAFTGITAYSAQIDPPIPCQTDPLKLTV